MKKYLTVMSDIERRIREGRFLPGGRFPSIRESAQQYHCSTNTIVRVYAELQKRHILYVVPQSGYYLVDRSIPGLAPEIDAGSINLSSSSPDAQLFPYQDFQHCMVKAIDTYREQLSTYSSSQGFDPLRRALTSHLGNDQVFTFEDRMYVTSGIQLCLEMLARMPYPNQGNQLLIEQPSYNNLLRYLEREKLQVKTIKRDYSGIDLDQLEAHFKSGTIKAFYTMPRYHNPLGTSLDRDTRQSIAALADQYDVYIIEDDYVADLGSSFGYEPIFASNRKDRVIYLKSFSKITFPGLRLGTVVLPVSLKTSFKELHRYCSAPLISQAAFELYVRNGMFDRHKSKIREQYEARMRQLHGALQLHRDSALFEAPHLESGIYMPIKLNRKVNVERLVQRLAERNISVTTGKKFYLSTVLAREKYVRISVARALLDRINDGVEAIIEEARRSLM